MLPLVVVAFLAVPILELYVILQVADVIGGWETLALLIAESLLGAWLVKREGRRTWEAFSAALDNHRAPGREVVDGALVLIGGTLLLTPGFLSDILGFLLLLPPTRPLARRLLLRLAARRAGRRFGMSFTVGGFGGRTRGGPGAGPGSRGGPSRTDVIEGEIVDERPDRPPGTRSGRVDLDKPSPNDGTPPRP